MPAIHTTKRLAIVARVSTEDQEEYGTSLDDQEAKGRLLAQLHDYTVDDRPYEQGGHIYRGDESGALPLAQRPIMRRLIADARAGRFDAVCFHKIDRIARRLRYILEIWDAFDDAGVAVHVIEPTIDTSTHIGRLIRNILGAIAEFDRDSIVDRTAAGRRRKLARGEPWLSGDFYGYTYTKGDRRAGVPGRVTIHEDQAALIRRIFERRAQGISYERIALELNADGIPSPKGQGRAVWCHSTIAKMLGNACYKGDGRWGRRESVRSATGGRSSRLRRDPAGHIPVTFPAIVSPELWRAANDMARCGATPVRSSVGKFLLRGGMVKCGEHGLTMCGSTGGSGLTRYRCLRPMGGKQPRRTEHTVPGRALDEAVWGDVIGFLADPTRGLAAARQLAAEAEGRLEELAARRIALGQRLRGLDEEAAELLRLARRRTVSTADLDRSMDEVNHQREDVHSELATLEAQVALATQDLPQAGEIERICEGLARGESYATPEERRALLDLLQVQVTMRGLDYSITGVVPELTLAGHVQDPTARVHDWTASYCAPTVHPRGFHLSGTVGAAARSLTGGARAG